MTDHHQIVVVSGEQGSGKSLLIRSAMAGGPWVAHLEVDTAGQSLYSSSVTADIRRACIELDSCKCLTGSGLTALFIEGAHSPAEWELDDLEILLHAVGRPNFVYVVATPDFELR